MRAPVSTIVTCHNLERYLGEAVESVKAQTLPPQELIIVHDFCNHPTSYAEATTVIRDYHKGVAKSRDEGVRLSTCPYILFLDADDVLAESFIEEALPVLEKGADVAYPDVLLWSRWGEAVHANKWHRSPRRITMQNMLRFNQIVISSLIRREVYEAVGGFDPSLEVFEDWQFWLEALKQGFRFKKANTYLKYRQRTGGRNRQNDELKTKVYQLVSEKYNNAQKQTD